jgi:hypothetical protein
MLLAGPPQGFGRIRHKASDECVLRRIRPSAEIQADPDWTPD